MNKLAWALLSACAWMPAAMADDAPGAPPTISVGGLYEFPDSHRDSDNGYGGHATFDVPLHSRPGEGVEFDFYGLKRDADAGGSDSQFGLFANYYKGFGLYGWDQDQGVERYLPSFSPYGLAGVGLARDDVDNNVHYKPALDVALGLAFRSAPAACRCAPKRARSASSTTSRCPTKASSSMCNCASV
jgi:OOP family OmpA-OmpF porin